MSNVFFISDPHLGHENILKYSADTRTFSSIKEHDEYICDEWCSKVSKRDLVWVGGDLGSKEYAVKRIASLPGTKKLIRGNHDQMPLSMYLEGFVDIQSMIKYRGYWLTHCPIHPDELWGKRNIHGHVHSNSIKLPDGSLDDRYINLCMENRAQFDGHTIIPLDLIEERWPAKIPTTPIGEGNG